MTASTEPVAPEPPPEVRGTAALQGTNGQTLTNPPEALAGGRVPDFFIVGHEKCGTTSLYKILRSHPQIFMPELKEPRFFSREPDAVQPAKATLRPRTFDAYLSLFEAASPEQRVGEASPQYIRSENAARRIAEVQPDARIIVVLREPTSFLRTYHLQNVRGRIENERDLRKALALEPARHEGKHIPRDARAPNRLFYSEHVGYVEQLRRFRAVFPPDQVLVLIYEDFRADNESTVRRVLRFLDVNDALPLAKVETTRARKAVRFRGLHRVAMAVRQARREPERAGRLSRLVEALTPRQLRSNAVENVLRRVIFAVPPPPDEQFDLELRRRFKPEVQALSEFLGRDLVSFWGYGDLD
jgi:hypothetical protein